VAKDVNMARLSDLREGGTPRNPEQGRIRYAFTLLVVVSLVALAGFALLTSSSMLASLGTWRPTVLFAFGLFFAALSYKGADTAMFGAYVMAYFISSLSRSESPSEGDPRERIWGLQPYLRQHRGKALIASAVALVYGVASLLAYVVFLILGSYELAMIFDRQLSPSIVGLVVAILTLAAAVPAGLSSISAMRTYFTSPWTSASRKVDSDDASPSG